MIGFGNWMGPGLPPGANRPFGVADASVRVHDGKRLTFRDCTWSIVSGLATKDSSWIVLGGESRSLSWEIKTYQFTIRDLSWRLSSLKENGLSWLIKNSTAGPVAWNVLTRIAKPSSWIVLAGATTSPAWRVLCAHRPDISWALLASRNWPTAWRVINRDGRGMAWGVVNASSNRLAWRNLSTLDRALSSTIVNAAHTQVASRIMTRRHWQTDWRVQPALLEGFAWDVRAAAHAESSWQLEATLETEVASLVLGAVSLEAEWGVHAYHRLALEIASRIFGRDEHVLASRVLHAVTRDLVSRVARTHRQLSSWNVAASWVPVTTFEVLPRAQAFVVCVPERVLSHRGTISAHEASFAGFVFDLKNH